MAKQKIIFLSGTVANVIFYEFRGTPCARSKPAKVRQTKATRLSAKQFGKAARMSSMFRTKLDPILPDPKDKRLMYRLNNALLQWLLNTKPGNRKLTTELPSIDQFQFNEESSLTERLKFPITIDWTNPGKIILDIPKLVPTKDIAAPAYTKKMNWQIMVVSCTNDDRPEVTGSYTMEMDMVYNEKLMPAKRVELHFVLNPEEITIVGLGLKYTAVKKGSLEVVTDKRWLPAGILGACFKTR